MRKPELDMQIFKRRRHQVGQDIQGSALILAASPEAIRNFDVHHPYRQDSNLYYLTGFEEPESVLLLRPGRDPEAVLFVRSKDVERETWDGFRYGPEGAEEYFLVDRAYPIQDFEERAAELLLEVDQVYYSQFRDVAFDRRLQDTLLRVQTRARRSGRGLLPILDAYPLLGEFRLRKDDHELKMMRESAEIAAQAHIEVIKLTSPGINERALYGRFLYEIMARGASGPSYQGIFASGANATTLHYVFNDQECRAGEVILVDAGAEVHGYASDITRSFPVSKQFTSAQKELYNQVLEVQKKIIALMRPGTNYSQLQETTVAALVEVMLDHKLLKGSPQEIIEKGSYRKYYPHGVSHFLGLDVHDAGKTELAKGQGRPLEERMVLTVEPGIYIPAQDLEAPPELRGLGIRIEDDVLITAEGPEVLTQGVPKEVHEIEALRS